MKKSEYKLRELLSMVNPFGFTAEGVYIVFGNPVACYVFAITEIALRSHGGYLDIPLLMVQKQDVDLQEARRLCKHQDYMSVHWTDTERSKDEIGIIVRMLLRVTEVSFNESYFEKAWEKFIKCYLYENEKTSKIQSENNG